jgi:high-affinity iron transporter
LNGGGGWGIFNAILGWQNSATYGSVISYNVYWIAVIIGFLLLRYKETTGHLPFMKAKAAKESDHVSDEVSPGSSGIFESKVAEKNVQAVTTEPARTVSE